MLQVSTLKVVSNSWYFLREKDSKVKIPSIFQNNQENLKKLWKNKNFYETLELNKINFVYLLQFKN